VAERSCQAVVGLGCVPAAKQAGVPDMASGAAALAEAVAQQLEAAVAATVSLSSGGNMIKQVLQAGKHNWLSMTSSCRGPSLHCHRDDLIS
jgi:hypothetical protein